MVYIKMSVAAVMCGLMINVTLAGVTVQPRKAAMPVYFDSTSMLEVGTAEPTDTLSVLPGSGGNRLCVMKVDGLKGYVETDGVKIYDAAVDHTGAYTYDVMTRDIGELKAKYADKLQVDTLCTTADGRCVFDLSTGNHECGRNVMIQAAAHAREYLNARLCMEQMEQLLALSGEATYNGVALKDVLDSVCLHLIPMLNPDGVSISQFGENGIRNDSLRAGLKEMYDRERPYVTTRVRIRRRRYRTIRKRISYQDYLRRWKANARGVDLNRNFPHGWGDHNNKEYPSSKNYCGDSALSEPEAKALAELTLKLKPSGVVSYHSSGEIAYDDVTGCRSADNKDFSDIFIRITGYRRQRKCQANGGYGDYVLSLPLGIHSVTLETGKAASPLPFRCYDRIWRQNRNVMPELTVYGSGVRHDKTPENEKGNGAENVTEPVIDVPAEADENEDMGGWQ